MNELEKDYLEIANRLDRIKLAAQRAKITIDKLVAETQEIRNEFHAKWTWFHKKNIGGEEADQS